MINEETAKIADRLLIWKIKDESCSVSRKAMEFRSILEFLSYLRESCISRTTDGDNEGESNRYNDIIILVEELTKTITLKTPLEEIAENVVIINNDLNLNLSISTSKKHTAYGTNKYKKKLIVDFS